MDSSTNKNEDLTIDIKKKDEVSKDDKIFGIRLCDKVYRLLSSCEAKTEYERDHRGKKEAKTTWSYRKDVLMVNYLINHVIQKVGFVKHTMKGYYQ